MIALELLRRYWLHLATAAAAVYIGFSLYGHGLKQGRLEVRAEWAAESKQIADALTAASEAARAKELANQAAMNKVQSDATQRLEQARLDAAGANSAADRLREQVDKLLAADRTSQGAGSCPRRPAAQNPGNLLAVVLDKSVARNRELAAFADAAMTAAQACAAGYRAVQSR